VHLAVGGHEHVGRLQVAVHDEPRVRVRHRLRHLQEQPQARARGQRLLRAPGIDGHAVDVLEGEKGPAALVEPASYRRAMWGCSRRALMSRSRAMRSASPAPQARCGSLSATWRLQRAVDAFGDPDAAHAAAGDLAQQAVGAHQVAGVRRRFERRLGQPGHRLEERSRAAVRVEHAAKGVRRTAGRRPARRRAISRAAAAPAPAPRRGAG
jgi:hypothetical protein